MAREEHRELVEAPVWQPLRLPRGSSVERFFGEYGAQVETEGGRRSAVDSTLPLRSDVGEGPKRLADLGLEDRGGTLVPENPLVETRIPRRPMDGVELGNDGFAVGLESPSREEAVVVEERAFVANALTDTDLVVAPTPRGVQISLQVRSADAPDEATLPIDLPEGAELRLVEEQADGSPFGPDGEAPGSVEVVRGDRVLASIRPPAAWDADGEPLADVRYELRDGDLVVHFPHRSADLLYPLAVDPQVDRFRINEDGSPTANGSYVIGHSNDLERAAWNFNNGGTGSQHYGQFPQQAGFTYEHNNLLAIANVTGQYFDNNAFGQWYWQAPRQSWIQRADFVNLHFTPTYGAQAQCVLEGVYSVTRGNWEANATYGSPPAGGPTYPGPWVGGPAPDGSCSPQSFDSKSHFNHVSPTPGNISVLRLFAFGSGVRSGEARAHLDGAAVHLEDGQHPSVTSASSSPGGWVRSATVSTSVGGRDAAPGAPAGQGGLGMLATNVFVPKEGGGSVQKGTFVTCHLRLSRCPESASQSYSYSTDGDLDPAAAGNQRMPEGANTITGVLVDATGKQTSFTAGTVRVDRSVPEAEIAGFADGELLRDRDYAITGDGLDSVSGVQSVVVRLDGTEKARRTSCPSGANVTCTASFTLDGGDPALTEGQHTVQTVVTDLAGNTRSANRNFRVDRTPPSFDFEGTLKPPDTTFVTPTIEGIALDAVDDTTNGAGTGATHAELLVDGAQVPGQSFDQSCSDPACQLSADFEVDLGSYADGQHSVSTLVRDGAGNTAPAQSWTINIERTPPSLVVTGDLKAAAGQTLDAGRTYSVTASALESASVPNQSGMGTLEFAVDENEPQTVERSCEMGGCPLSHTFTYNPDDHGSEDHTIRVTATDAAGNQTTDSFVVKNPDPPPLSCDPAPAPSTAGSGAPVTPEAARQSFEQHLPEAVAPSTQFDLDGRILEPGLDASIAPLNQNFSATGGLVEQTIASEAPGYRAELTALTNDSIGCLTPTGINPLASEPTAPIGGAATVYANSNTATDTLLRPSAAGTNTVTQLRDVTAPQELSWHVATSPGQRLQMLPNGNAAVVMPADPAWRTPTEAADDLPPAPTVAERRQAISDTALGLDQASTDLQRAQASVPDEVVALISKPDAEGRNGPVATSLSVSGSTVTMRVEHGLATAYPVIASHRLTVADGVYDYESLTAVADTRDYSDAEAEAHQPPELEGGAPEASAYSTEQPAGDQSEEATDAQDPDEPDAGASDVDVDGEGEERGRADPTVPVRADMAANMGALRVGISQSDQTVFASLSRPEISSLRPVAVRAFVPWNFVKLKKAMDDGMPPKDRPKAVADVNRVNELIADYRRRYKGIGGIGGRPRIDVVFAQDVTRKPPGVEEYRRATRMFLDRYLREQDPQTKKDENLGVNFDNVMAWNEPDNTSDKAGGIPNQLAKKPARAAGLWTAAHSLCKPKEQGVKDLCRYAVAGDYVSSSRGPLVKFRGKMAPYHRVYSIWLGQHVRLERRPRVWGFHASGDMALYMTATERKKRFTMPTTKKYRDIYAKYSYKENRNSGERRPLIWATEVGAPYRLPCRTIRNPEARKDRCLVGDKTVPEEKIVLQMGMRLQRDAVAFLFRRIAQQFPEVSRLYYFDLHRSRNVDGVTAPFCCPELDRSLIGSDADDERSGQSNTSYKLEEERTRTRTPSTPQQPRLAFCIVRDRSLTKKLSRPQTRVTECPKSDE